MQLVATQPGQTKIFKLGFSYSRVFRTIEQTCFCDILDDNAMDRRRKLEAAAFHPPLRRDNCVAMPLSRDLPLLATDLEVGRKRGLAIGRVVLCDAALPQLVFR